MAAATYMPVSSEKSDSRWKTVLRSRWAWISASVILIVAVVYWPWLLQRNHSIWCFGLLAGGTATASACCSPAAARVTCLQPLPVEASSPACGCFMEALAGGTAPFTTEAFIGRIFTPAPPAISPPFFKFALAGRASIDQIAFTLPAIHGHWPSFISSRFWWPAADFDVTAKAMFNTIYGITLLLSGIAIGIQTRRNDRRALVAFVTPWIMFFLFPVQIQERYLLYAVGVAACCIGNSVGTALLGLLLTAFSVMMPMKILVDIGSSDLDQFGQNLSDAMPWLFSPDSGHTIQHYLDGTQPDIAWGILIIGLVFLYLSLTPSPRRQLQR